MKVYYIKELGRPGAGKILKLKILPIMGVVIAEDKNSALEKTAKELGGKIVSDYGGEKVIRRSDKGHGENLIDLILEEVKLVIL